MGTFLKSGSAKPIEPVMNLYELDIREPVASIDCHGMLWVKKVNLPKMLFAEVPVVIHTVHGISLAPREAASTNTGPEDGNW